jgi:hypothetical protein
MSRRVGRASIGIAIAASTAALSLISAPVRADEAYLCGPDTVVYVAVADLEMKKRTDPCIAAYYGLKVDDAANASAVLGPVAPSSDGTPAAAPLTLLKSLTDADGSSRQSPKLERQASLEPPRAAPGTDFRNVKVINALLPEETWFHHAR